MVNSTVITGFAMGIAGSVHCMGMCGPLALALPLDRNNLFAKFTGSLLYNAGRVATYSLFGLMAGLVGKSFALFGFQQWLSVTLGIAIILLVVLPKLFPAYFKTRYAGVGFFTRLRQAVAGLFFKKNQSALFAIGVLNGLLPCGMVYIAMATAAATGDVQNSVLFMAAFGAGTLPAMWAVAFWGNFIGANIRSTIRKAYPSLMVLMACLLIVRGMTLGIPYLSPKADVVKKEVKCCVKP
jgi:uncharacterized protein